MTPTYYWDRDDSKGIRSFLGYWKMIPLVVARRIKGIGVSGIWNYRNDFHMTPARNAWKPGLSQLEAASMKDIILLVFLVVITGLAMSLIGFLFEYSLFKEPLVLYNTIKFE